MRKGRILSVIMLICVQLAVCIADQERMDAFQADRRTEDSPAESDKSRQDVGQAEKDAERGQSIEQAEEGAESGQGMEQAEEDAGSETEAEADSGKMSDISYMQTYRLFLEAYREENENASGTRIMFALIDDDYIPELLLFEDDCHAAVVKVYTCDQDSVIELGGFGSFGRMQYVERGGMILSAYTGQGENYAAFFRVEGKEAGEICSMYSYAPPDGSPEIFKIDDVGVTEEIYQKKWRELYDADKYKVIGYEDAFSLSELGTEELLAKARDALQMQEDVLKQNVLTAAGAQEENILLFDYDDYDGDGKYEAFMIVGRTFDNYGDLGYHGALYFAGADGSISELDDSFGIYRKIDGKMEFSPGRKYLFFYTDYVFTANATELWTVRNGKPVDESELFGPYQVVYRGENERNEFEVWVDAYDQFCEKGGFRSGEDMWWGHTYKPYFWYYDSDTDQIRKYGGRIITKGDFEELGGTDVIEGIKEEGYTIGEIIRWDNDIVTVNYHYEHLGEDGNPSGCEVYDNVIWDNAVKDYWRKDERFVISWRTAGVGGSYYL